MEITISLFAGLVDRIGTSRLALEVPEHNLSVHQLKELLAETYPSAASLITVSFIAVNQEYARGDVIITAKDEVALIPPVSGGEPEQVDNTPPSEERYSITTEPLCVETITQKVITANHGANLTFIGTTRELTGNKRTLHLEYEAYIPMALSKLRQIGSEVEQQWPGALCAISHRIGKVEIAESSVVIAVSSPHRAHCYEASRYAIERLKQIVPIWKKEIWEDGTQWLGHGQGPWDPSAPGVNSRTNV